MIDYEPYLLQEKAELKEAFDLGLQMDEIYERYRAPPRKSRKRQADTRPAGHQPRSRLTQSQPHLAPFTMQNQRKRRYIDWGEDGEERPEKICATTVNAATQNDREENFANPGEDEELRGQPSVSVPYEEPQKTRTTDGTLSRVVSVPFTLAPILGPDFPGFIKLPPYSLLQA